MPKKKKVIIKKTIEGIFIIEEIDAKETFDNLPPPPKKRRRKK